MISDESFRENEHVLKSREFALIYKKGSSFKKGPVILYILPNPFGYNRIGFSIGSRNIKSAVRRNRIRRLFREVFRKTKKELRAGCDMVFIVKRDPGRTFSYKDAQEIFVKLMKDIRLLQ